MAVNGVNLRIARGSIHALIGPNGAGKTTCFNLLTKFLPPTRGQHPVQGPRHHRACKPADVARLGLVRSLSDFRGVSPSDRAGKCAHRAAAHARRLASISGARSACSTTTTTAPGTARRCRPERIMRNRRGRTALWPQARAGNRHHAGARSRNDAARRADGRHGRTRTLTASSL